MAAWIWEIVSFLVLGGDGTFWPTTELHVALKIQVRTRNYDRKNPGTPMDWTDSNFVAIFFLFVINWVASVSFDTQLNGRLIS
jgi:hypothetical protein